MTLVTVPGSAVLHVCEYPERRHDGTETSSCGRDGMSRILPADLVVLGRMAVCGHCCRRSPAARRVRHAIAQAQQRFSRATGGGRGTRAGGR